MRSFLSDAKFIPDLKKIIEKFTHITIKKIHFNKPVMQLEHLSINFTWIRCQRIETAL